MTNKECPMTKYRKKSTGVEFVGYWKFLVGHWIFIIILYGGT